MKETILQDKSATGKERPWRKHKMANELLSMAYEGINPKKAERLADCASRLTFHPSADGFRLRGANFCRVRLCPMCSWRRSLKVAAQMHAIMNAIKEDKPQAYILLTLTQKNCEAENLSNEITLTLRAFSNLTKRTEFQKAVNGFYRAMEITHNITHTDISYDTYHPHIHAVLAVNPSYFTGRQYIKRERWRELWKEALDLDYLPQVDVRRIKGDTSEAVAEVAKYAVKSSDYIIPDDWDLTIETVRILDSALDGRKFIGFGGIFRKYHKKLNLDDADDGDLVHIEDDDKPSEDERVIHFVWYSGYRQYISE